MWRGVPDTTMCDKVLLAACNSVFFSIVVFQFHPQTKLPTPKIVKRGAKHPQLNTTYKQTHKMSCVDF